LILAYFLSILLASGNEEDPGIGKESKVILKQARETYMNFY
jgi:hypothetical protein